MIPYKQLSLADIFSDCQDIFNTDKPEFLSLFETYINLDEIVPASFFLHYYSSTGRSRRKKGPSRKKGVRLELFTYGLIINIIERVMYFSRDIKPYYVTKITIYSR